MIFDSISLMGQTHRANEDYVCRRGEVITLCDGCSSSPFTEVGSRILAHSFVEHEDHDNAMRVAQAACLSLNLPPQALDCTILRLSPGWWGGITAEVCGDGVVFYGMFDGSELHVHDFDYNDLVPYASCEEHWYDEGIEGMERHYTLRPGENNCDYEQTVLTNGGWRYVNIQRDFDFYGVASDGLSNLYSAENEKVGACLAAAELCKFKVPTGEFVQRRAKRMLKTNDWHNPDDLTIGVVNAATKD